jgi:hypothetical protein
LARDRVRGEVASPQDDGGRARGIADSRLRAWIGRRFGGDAELGDRIGRRAVHALGAGALVYYLLPTPLYGFLYRQEILLAALGAVLLLEGVRHATRYPLPLIRPYEERRVAGFAFYAVALAVVLLLFPRPIACAVVLGTAIVDPVSGELRSGAARLYPGLPLALYAGLAVLGLAGLGGWPIGPSLVLAAVGAVLAVAAEAPKLLWLDDDLTMTFVPALALLALAGAVLHLGV